MQTVLLLNMNYEPLRTLSARNALRLIMRGCVEPVINMDGAVDPATDKSGQPVVVRSVRESIVLPSILRLRRYVNVPQRDAFYSTHDVKERDRYTCIYCGAKIGDHKNKREVYVRQDFTVDHLIPRSRGGRNTWSNTACSCWQCNNRKGARTPEEAGMKLLWEPKTPRVGYLTLSGDLPEPWKVYIQTP